MNSVILQSVMEMQKAISEIGAKTDRLIVDVGKQNEKIEALRGTVNFVRGVIWLAGVLLAACLAIGIAVYNKVVPAPAPITPPPASSSPR